MKVRKKSKVLHILAGLDRGGAETWLVNVMREIDRERFQFDFAVTSSKEGAYEAELEDMGCRVFHLNHPRNPIGYIYGLVITILREGPYDVIHSHVHHFSGVVLAVAYLLQVPIRIAHSHNDLESVKRSSGFLRQVYYRLTSWLTRKSLTAGLAVSEKAAVSLYGQDWQSDQRISVSYCGIQPLQFEREGILRDVRAELGVPHDAFVIGHVGSFTRQKNHGFLLDVAQLLESRISNFLFLLVGDGPARHQFEADIRARGLESRFLLLGLRGDVPSLMMNAMDVFVLPSYHEGLPIVGLEAQAAGLPCMFSEEITRELALAEDAVSFLPIYGEFSAESWADCLVQLSRNSFARDLSTSIQRFQGSRFDVATGARALEAIYAREL